VIALQFSGNKTVVLFLFIPFKLGGAREMSGLGKRQKEADFQFWPKIRSYANQASLDFCHAPGVWPW
jgi:hypothetical protein